MYLSKAICTKQNIEIKQPNSVFIHIYKPSIFIDISQVPESYKKIVSNISIHIDK